MKATKRLCKALCIGAMACMVASCGHDYSKGLARLRTELQATGDTVLAWTFLDGESREAFRERLPVDEGTWARGRGWALWKALITMAWNPDANPAFTAECRSVLASVIAEHRDAS